jgi:sigma-E factor negative regulatory protein RseC
MTHGPKAVEVSALNLAGAAIGDRVELVCDSGPLLRATFLIYIFPVLCLLMGAALGHWLALEFGYDTALVSPSLGLIGLLLSLAIVRSRGNRLARHAAYQPKISRILAKAAPAAPAVQSVKPLS